MVEKKTRNPLKGLRTDNGGEYISREFKDYCSKHGIRHEKTVSSIPQHNGVAERMNWTIVEKVLCILKLVKLPKSFWGEAVNTVVYLINKWPSIPFDFDIPQRIWTRKDVSYSHLKVFGCKAFMHVPKEQRSKLDDKTTLGIFIGDGDEEFSYRLWDSEKQKIVRSRDVMFHEHETIKDMEKNVSGAKLTYEGVVDLTPEQNLLERATNEVEMSKSKPGTELEEPVIEEEESGDDSDMGGVDLGKKIPPLEEEPQLRWTTRERQPSTRYPSSEYILIVDDGEPESFQAVQSHKEKDCWIKAMREEMNSLWKNDTYELIELPKGRKALKNKWLFKLKNDDEKLLKYKARLVVKGFDQKQGIDFDEIFSSIIKMCSIRVIVELAASMNLKLEQLDVKTTFSTW